MAKRNNETSTSETNNGNDDFAALKKLLDQKQDGFITQSDDIVGYWNPELCPILCIPRSAKLFDNNIDSKKASVLIIVELAERCIVEGKKDEGAEKFIANKGDMVGVWGKPGMKPIRDNCGVVTKITLVGEKETGKPNPMKVFKVESRSKGARVPVIEDTRDESRDCNTIFTGASLTGRDSANSKDDGDLTVPF